MSLFFIVNIAMASCVLVDRSQGDDQQKNTQFGEDVKFWVGGAVKPSFIMVTFCCCILSVIIPRCEIHCHPHLHHHHCDNSL